METKRGRFIVGNHLSSGDVDVLSILTTKPYGITALQPLKSVRSIVLSFPKQLEKEFWQELKTYEEERKVPYITSTMRLK